MNHSATDSWDPSNEWCGKQILLTAAQVTLVLTSKMHRLLKVYTSDNVDFAFQMVSTLKWLIPSQHMKKKHTIKDLRARSLTASFQRLHPGLQEFMKFNTLGGSLLFKSLYFKLVTKNTGQVQVFRDRTWNNLIKFLFCATLRVSC